MRSEHDEQKALVSWFDMQYRELAGRLAASSAGARMSMRTAVKEKAAGMRKGFPDLMLMTPRAGYFGLFIEMKREDGGKVSPEQRDWLEWLSGQGFLAVICNGFYEAQTVIKHYLEGEARAA